MRVGFPLDALAENDELVPAQARGDVRGAELISKAIGDLDEESVARVGPTRLVQLLEAVDVHEQQRRRACARLNPGQRAFEVGEQEGAIGKTCE